MNVVLHHTLICLVSWILSLGIGLIISFGLSFGLKRLIGDVEKLFDGEVEKK